MAAYEVPPILAEKCVIAATGESATEYSDFFVILDVLIGEGVFKYGWTVKDWGKLLTVSKAVYDRLRRQSFWLRDLGFGLARVPARFSPLLLYIHLRKETKNAEWDRRLLTTAVKEARNPSVMTPLVVSLTGEESLQMWQGELVALLKLSTYPTQPQAMLLSSLLDLCLSKGTKATEFIPLALTINEEKRNRVLFVVLAFELVKLIKTMQKKEKVGITAEDLSAILPDVTSILQFVALNNGLIVDNFKDEKWKLTRKNLNHVTQRAVVHSLASLSWLGLADAFKKKGLFKMVAKNIHLGALVKQALIANPKDKNLIQLRLFLYCLRAAKYPSKPEDFAKWKEEVITPLRSLCETNPLFDLNNKKFLALDFDPSLSSKPLPKPAKRTVEGVLAQEGNTVTSWDKLFKAGVVSPAQALANIRSLILLDYPLEVISKLLVSRIDTLNPIKLLKLRQFINSIFTKEFVAEVHAKKEEIIKKRNGKDKDYYDIDMPPQIFKDAKGKTTEKVINRNVSANFDGKTVEKYLELLTSLFTQLSAKFVPKVNPKCARSVIVLTSELRNAMRSGMPPSIPSYSRTSLWRNEGICLQQLAQPGEKFNSLRLGMTWCQTPTQEDIDLDLTLMLYDDTWTYLAECSFSTLSIQGAQHSGDFTEAPYPDGAREAVDIDFAALLKGHPTVRYCVVMVYSYSGQDMDQLHDGSVFVANPLSSGTGPGGMDVISAARLSGKGTSNCAGFIALEDGTPNTRITFFCVDQTFRGNERAGSSSTDRVATELGRITKNVQVADPPYVRLSLLSAYYAALLSDEVVIVHDGGEKVVKFDGKGSRIDFFKQLSKELMPLRDTLSSKVPMISVADKEHDHLYVFGGELVQPTQVYMANPSYVNIEDPHTITVVNLRADVAKEEVKPVTSKAKITVVTSTDILDFFKKA